MHILAFSGTVEKSRGKFRSERISERIAVRLRHWDPDYWQRADPNQHGRHRNFIFPGKVSKLLPIQNLKFIITGFNI
jgi:hypothetical protein